MKTKRMILTSLLLCLTLTGCASVGEVLPGQTTDTGTNGNNVPQAAAYEAMIAQLQQELLALQAEHSEQTAAYEQRISELESELAGTGSGETKPPESEKPSDTASLYTYADCDGGIIITGYLGREGQVKIPSEIDGKKVVGIGEGAFRNSAAEQVIVPDGVLSIGWFAFSGSYKLSSVILPASVNVIEYGAFELCSSSLRITCPAGSYAAKYAVSYGIPVIPKTV